MSGDRGSGGIAAAAVKCEDDPEGKFDEKFKDKSDETDHDDQKRFYHAVEETLYGFSKGRQGAREMGHEILRMSESGFRRWHIPVSVRPV